jgi:7,8-dihydropterin-6-yl-methyl-4-(beta-D-ribofuranosyl)aminobenzene 5'-phosphate synthase
MGDRIAINEVDRIEILTLQDNYIDITAGDNSEIVLRAMPVREGEIRASVLAEHGFSAIVKTTTGDRTRTMLFDFGFSEGGAAYNAGVLGVDMGAVEAVAISHGHSDHLGGFAKLLELIGNKGIEFVAHPKVFHSPRYIKIGEDFRIYFPKFSREMAQQAGVRIVETEGPYLLLDGDVLFLGKIERVTDFEQGLPAAHFELEGLEMWDAIEDDTSIVMNLRGRGLVVLSGCAHAGIVNTVRYAREVTGVEAVHAIMGGFHLSGRAFEAIVERTTEELMQIAPAYVVPTHCTGRKAIMTIEQAMPDQFILNMSGTKLTFSAD